MQGRICIDQHNDWKIDLVFAARARTSSRYHSGPSAVDTITLGIIGTLMAWFKCAWVRRNQDKTLDAIGCRFLKLFPVTSEIT